MSQSEIKDFVRVKDSKFILSDNPYYFAGINMWYACYLGSTDEGRARLINELDTLKNLGITNLRILGASEESDLIASLKSAIQPSPGVYNETLLEGLDFAMAEIGKRNMHAVIYLNNFWQWSGGMAQYVNWVTGDKIPDPDTDNDWEAFISFSARFYTLPRAVSLYRNYIEYIINRTNKFTKIQYRNDPAIMAWELANEPRPGASNGSGISNMDSYVKWVDETAAFIHSIDSNHLVTTGMEGTHGCLENAEYFLRIHQSRHIDYINAHVWPKNWGWFNPNNIEGTYHASEKNAINYIKNHFGYALTLKKPITIEEFGIDRDNGNFLPGTPCTARDRYFKRILTFVSDNARNGIPVYGTNIWAWGGYGIPHPVNEVTGIAEAFIGDQLGEPQGLNSIFITDSSTLKIISIHAKKMSMLPE